MASTEEEDMKDSNSKPIPDRLRPIIITIMDLCKDLSLDEMGWIASAFLTLTAMKVEPREF
jgi:hypothetical protein